ncbi:MAG: hypothetical protein HGA87_00405 [Desulfobulbaceae bacterium]|nr:hypothetical protein [Desulfobulbaceae bacterium]
MKATQSIIKPFLSRDGLRPSMQHVHYACDEKVFEATDGHHLIVWADLELSELIKSDCLIPIEAFPRTRKDIIKLKTGSKSVVVDDIGRKIKMILPLGKEKFPATISVWKKEIEAGAQLDMAFNSRFISDFYGFASCFRPHAPDIVLTFQGRTGPIIITPDDPDGEWKGLLMPVRPRN